MGSSAVTERVPVTQTQQTKLLNRIAVAQKRVDHHLRGADEWKERRYELVEAAKVGGIKNKDIADALGMTVPGVVKIIERGRATNGT